MFFEFSKSKVRGLILIAVILLFGVGAHLYMEDRYHAVEKSWGASRRVLADIRYLFMHKIPYDAVAFAGEFTSLGKPAAESEAAETQARMAKALPVLLYHGEGSGTHIPPGTFARHMLALKKNGWRTITLEEFRAFMKEGKPLPEKSFLLTFDDGRRDTFYGSDPALKDLGYTAVMYVITGFSLPREGSRSPFYLSQPELEYMAKSGRWELESHGDQDHLGYAVPRAVAEDQAPSFVESEHFVSNRLWLAEEGRMETVEEYTARVENDLATSKRILERTFGKPVLSYAYPFNDFGQGSVNFPQSKEILERLVPQVYTFGMYQTWNGNGDLFNYPDPQEYFIKRIEPAPSWTTQDLLAVLSGGMDKALPYENSAFSQHDWSVNWGLAEYGNNLVLKAEVDSTGGTAFLYGSGGWSDYRAELTTASLTGTVSLLARYVDSDRPYGACSFSEDTIYVERKSAGGKHDIVASTRYSPPLAGERTVSMSVVGEQVICSAYGKTVSAQVSGISHTGTAGVEVWALHNGDAYMEVARFTASAL